MDVKSYIDSNKELFIKVNDQIWEYAETRFEEYKSAELLEQVLAEHGFTVKKNLAGMETAFVAEYGSGQPVIGILGEYDALSGLSQQGGSIVRQPIVDGAPGHGCGHNTLGAASLAAAMAVKEYLEQSKSAGTIRYYGCPGEEGGSGKAYMAREGLFDDLDAALTWHPGGYNAIMALSSLANFQVYYRFHGRAAHAAGAPHLGRSALDAVELMSVGVNYLREHVIPEARMHYAITNTGGTAPNVVQAEAEVLYLMRAPELSYVQEMYQRINDIARGAALMTGTQVEIIFDKACSNYIPNHTLGKVLLKYLTEVVAENSYTPQEISFADKIGQTFPKSGSALKKFLPLLDEEGQALVREIEKSRLSNKTLPYLKMASPMAGSTDVGDVSWVTPTAQFAAACCALGTPGHSWQFVSQNNTSIAHKGLLIAGKTLALSAIEMLENPQILKEAQTELLKQLNGQKYTCPIPKEVNPAVHR